MTNFDFAAARERWDQAAASEEAWASRPSVNRSLRWREVLRHTDGVCAVLDVGAGTGAFSIPLAERGIDVTHLDFAPAMIEMAQQKARHCKHWRAIEANAVDLSQFPDRSFDLVLNMDGTISNSGPFAEDVVRESCRVTRHTLILSMTHRAFVEVAALRGEPSDPLRGFTSLEIRQMLEAEGLVVIRAGGLGSLATLVGRDYVRQQLEDSGALERFVDACEAFDREVLPEGAGTSDDTGLMAVAVRRA